MVPAPVNTCQHVCLHGWMFLKRKKILKKYVKRHLAPENLIYMFTASLLPLAIPYVLELNKCNNRNRTFSPSVREFWFRNPGNFCFWNPELGKILLVECGILEFGIQNTAPGIWNPTNEWNPESKFHWQRLESTVWNPESKTVLDSLTWGKPLLEHKKYFNPYNS